LTDAIDPGLWPTGGFISSKCKREFESKYKKSDALALRGTVSILWATILVYTVILLVRIMRTRLPGVRTNIGYSHLPLRRRSSPGACLPRSRAGRNDVHRNMRNLLNES